MSRKETEKCLHLVEAIRQLGFDLSEIQDEEALQGKDFVQLKNGPFDLDLVFALSQIVPRLLGQYPTTMLDQCPRLSFY